MNLRISKFPIHHSSFGILHFFVFSIALFDPPARAADHFLTIGGGNSAENNQVSLEKNVLFFQHVLAMKGLGDVPHEILFTDGQAGARDLSYIDHQAAVPRVNQLLAGVFDFDTELNVQYRAHAIPHLWGPSGRQSIQKWFDTIGAGIKEDDRLFIYFTGHGGHGEGNPPINQTLAMWNEPGMNVHDFDVLLDKLPPKVAVVLIMVQCFGGGFADVIFDDADSKKGLSPRNRCGFFATIPTRVAAGCTSDVDEENYKEYSTSFWAALCGQTRTGQKVALPDYDGDGRISLAEAHAYALIHSETVDISMKTSDVFLRKYSSQNGGERDPVTANGDYQRLASVANPIERAVLDALSAELGLEGAGRVRAARTAAETLGLQRKSVDEKKAKLEEEHKKLRRSLRLRLMNQWPELDNLMHPRAAQILTEHGDEIVRLLEGASQYKEYERQHQQIDDLDHKSDQLDHRWAMYHRFLRAANNAALAANLPKVATPEIVERYKVLIRLETGVLGSEEPKD